MTHKKKLFVLLSLLLPAAPYAAVSSVVYPVPQGAVACLSRKQAENYITYAKQAPDFAADLIARAACFKAEKNEEAVKLGAEKGFVKLKLLSGHTVWLPESHQ